jgi:hypothetical protein
MVRSVNGSVSGCADPDATMPLIHIDGPADPRIATYRSVSDAELLRRHGLFVAEGRLIVRRAIEEGFQLNSVLTNETNYRALADALAAVSPDVPVFVCETQDHRFQSASRLPGAGRTPASSSVVRDSSNRSHTRGARSRDQRG